MLASGKKTVPLFCVITLNFGIVSALHTTFTTNSEQRSTSFKMEIEEYPDLTKISTVEWKNKKIVLAQPIAKIPRAMRRDVCIAAKELAHLDGMNPKADIYNPYGYTFSSPGRLPRLIFAIRCSTIPQSFIYIPDLSGTATVEDRNDAAEEKNDVTEDKSNTVEDISRNYTVEEKILNLAQTEFRILLKENKFNSDEYKFIKHLVRPKQAPVAHRIVGMFGPLSKAESQLSLAENTIVKADTDLMDLCYAAKIRCGHTPTPVLNSLGAGKPQIYQFHTYLAHGVECPSTPKMYLNVTDSNDSINVIIVLEDAETETIESSEKSVNSTRVDKS